MKIVNIIGGLGNQMLLYAFALALKQRFSDEVVKIDVSHFNYLFLKKYKSSNLHNGYELNRIFPKAQLPVATFVDLIKLTWYIPNYWLSRLGRRILPIRKTEYVQKKKEIFAYSTNVLEIEGDCYYEGIWQAYKYFEPIREELFNVFSHPQPNSYNEQLIIQIQSTNSVGIHIRRGDYKYAADFNGICTEDYYRKAINYICKKNQSYCFFIFSNDISWCKSHINEMIPIGNKVVYVTDNVGMDSYWDMFLMTYCKDLILANSSFSWWGAYLNKNVDRVVVPNPWVRRDCLIENCPSSWVKL